jgi:hypothetical protein
VPSAALEPVHHPELRGSGEDRKQTPPKATSHLGEPRTITIIDPTAIIAGPVSLDASEPDVPFCAAVMGMTVVVLERRSVLVGCP